MGRPYLRLVSRAIAIAVIGSVDHSSVSRTIGIAQPGLPRRWTFGRSTRSGSAAACFVTSPNSCSAARVSGFQSAPPVPIAHAACASRRHAAAPARATSSMTIAL